MKIFLIIFSFLFLFADENLTQILKQVPKNSPEYSLDLTLVKEIKALKPKKLKFNLNVKTQDEYIKAFNKLVKLKLKLEEIDKKIDDIKNKLEILSSKKDATSKLQYIYYKKLLKIQQDLKTQIKENFPIYEKSLIKKLNEIEFKNIADIKNLQNRLNNYKLKIDNLKIDLQKWQLLNNQKQIDLTNSKIDFINRQIEKLYFEFIKNYEIKWFIALKEKSKEAFSLDDYILEYAKLINENLSEAYDEVIVDFEKEIFGSKMLVYGAEKGVEYSIKKIWEILNYPLFKVSDRTITPINFFMFVVILVLGWFIGQNYKRLIYRIRKNYELSHATATLLANMGYYAILAFSFLLSLKIIGLDLSSFALIAGALSVGIGFGLQNVVSNFVSGIILMFERSIKIGDYIQIDENTRGEVVDISMRSTIIRTNDNINLIIPNQAFIQNNVINWTLGDDIVRFRIPFSVEYGSDIEKVERVVLGALANSNIPYVKKDYRYDVKPYVVFLEMGDSSLNFELFVWVKGEYAKRPRRTRSEFLKMIYNALNKAGIGIPFPQQDLHIKDSIPLEIKLKKE